MHNAIFAGVGITHCKNPGASGTCIVIDSAAVRETLVAETAKILLAQGDFEIVSLEPKNLDMALENIQKVASHRSRIFAIADMARARFLLENHDQDEALILLQKVLEYALKSVRGQLEVEARLLMVQALKGQLSKAEADRKSMQSSVSGRKFGQRRTFMEQGETDIAMLAQLESCGNRHALHEQGQNGYLGRVMQQVASDTVRKQAKNRNPVGQDVGLTPRETEILALIGQGMPNKRVALTLGIAAGTVKWNLKNIYLKLGVSSRYDAVVWARNKGLLD